ncbi:MAG: hypothetical protein QM737_08380 [Ferruginibacter sp.]
MNKLIISVITIMIGITFTSFKKGVPANDSYGQVKTGKKYNNNADCVYYYPVLKEDCLPEEQSNIDDQPMEDSLVSGDMAVDAHLHSYRLTPVNLSMYSYYE